MLVEKGESMDIQKTITTKLVESADTISLQNTSSSGIVSTGKIQAGTKVFPVKFSLDTIPMSPSGNGYKVHPALGDYTMNDVQQALNRIENAVGRLERLKEQRTIIDRKRLGVSLAVENVLEMMGGMHDSQSILVRDVLHDYLHDLKEQS